MTSKLFTSIMLRAAAVACALIVPVAAQVSVLSDLENGTNQNSYGAYWYVYTDTADGGNSKVTNMTENADGTYNFLPTKDQGNTVTGGTPGYGAMVAFKLGTVKPHNTASSWGNMVGAGTMLAQKGSYFDLTGAKKIDFYAKVQGPATTVSLRVEVCTAEFAPANGGDNGYYHIIIPITNQWAKYTIPLDTTDNGYGKLVQWDWSVSNNGAKPFNIKKIFQIQWCISEDGNSTSWADATGTLWLDDIQISPFTPHFYDEIDTTKIGAPGAAGLDPKNLLTDFEKSMNAAKYYSYCYTDGVANPTGASTITAGATKDSLTNSYLLTLGDGGVSGKCADIQFELGTTFTSGKNTVMPFVGIGTNLSNDLGTTSTDLSSGTAIYFDYKLKSDQAKFMTLEVKTSQTFGNADAVYYIKLPNTNGAWKGATVSLKPNSLVLPLWDDVTPAAIDMTQTLKFQWKVQDAARATGEMGIDNVYVVGKDFTPVLFGKTLKAPAPDFVVKQTASAANIVFAMPQRLNTARLELATVQGKVIASQSVRNSGKACYQASFPTGRLASGTYMVRLSGENTILKTAMISIVK